MKRAIVLVPGFGKHEQLDARDKLVKSLQLYTDGWDTDFASPISHEGINVVRGTATSQKQDGTTVELSVYEAYWADLIPDWSNESPFARFRRGSSLILYWAMGGLAKALGRRKLPIRSTVALLIAAVLLICWYLGVIAVLLQAIAQGDFGEIGFLADLGIQEQMESLAQKISLWPIFLLLPSLVGLGRLERIANIASFTKSYLMDHIPGQDGFGPRAKAKDRLLQTLKFVYSREGDEAYDEVYVIGHSLGGAIAADALAEYENMHAKTVMFTWGSALGALVEQEKIIEDQIRKFYQSDVKIKNWVDIVFRKDVLGSIVPIPSRVNDEGKRISHDQIFPDAIVPRLPRGYSIFSPQVHDLYYYNETAILMLVVPAADLPQP